MSTFDRKNLKENGRLFVDLAGKYRLCGLAVYVILRIWQNAAEFEVELRVKGAGTHATRFNLDRTWSFVYVAEVTHVCPAYYIA